MIYGSSQTDPRYANYKGSQTYAPQSRPGVNVPFIGTGVAQSSPTTGGGQVLGATAPAPAVNTSTSDPSAQVRNDINSGYDAYFNSLNDVLNNGLPSQRAAQESIANSQYDQGVNQLNTQKNLGLQDLGTQRTNANTQQAKTLNDLSANIRNLFQSGNVYLGARGAADSSAANQYSYALTKLGSQQRGDVTAQYANIQNDINGRESRLNEIYNGEVNNLASQRDQQISGIAQWFSEQQNALKQAQAQGQLQKGQDLASLSQNLLNVALQQLQNVQAEAVNRKSALDQWAMNHSNDINQLKSNLSQVSTTNYTMPTAAPIGGISGTGTTAPSLFGFSNNTDQQKNSIFG